MFSDGLFLTVDNRGRKRGVLTVRRVSYSDTKYHVRTYTTLRKIMHLILTMTVSSSAFFWCFHDSSVVPITKFIIDLSHKTRRLWDT